MTGHDAQVIGRQLMIIIVLLSIVLQICNGLERSGLWTVEDCNFHARARTAENLGWCGINYQHAQGIIETDSSLHFYDTTHPAARSILCDTTRQYNQKTALSLVEGLEQCISSHESMIKWLRLHIARTVRILADNQATQLNTTRH